MKLIEADKVERAIKDYWKAQVDKALTLTDGNEKRINSYLKHNHELLKVIDELPSAEPDTTTHDSIPTKTGKNNGDRTSGDCISRQQAIDKFIDELEEIFSDIREREVDDSVCGLCEYDGAYIGQSGDWCNECPGFDRDDCFKLSDKIRKEWTDEIIKALPSVQPERLKGKWIHQSKFSRVECDQCGKVFRNTFAPKNFCPNCGADMRGDKHEID